MKALIVDDEKQARLSLVLLLKEYCPEIEVVGEGATLVEGVKLIRQLHPDLVFLDIEMPNHSGLEILDFFDEKEIDFCIVFTTAYNEYAIQAFKLSAVDYLLKPLAPKDLQQAVARVKTQKEIVNKYQLLKEMLGKSVASKIALPTGSSFILVTIEDIMYIRGTGAYSELYMFDESVHVVSKNLKAFEEMLKPFQDFLRIHKSYIVNFRYVRAYHKSEGGSLELVNKYKLPFSADKHYMITERVLTIKK